MTRVAGRNDARTPPDSAQTEQTESMYLEYLDNHGEWEILTQLTQSFRLEKERSRNLYARISKKKKKEAKKEN